MASSGALDWVQLPTAHSETDDGAWLLQNFGVLERGILQFHIVLFICLFSKANIYARVLAQQQNPCPKKKKKKKVLLIADVLKRQKITSPNNTADTISNFDCIRDICVFIYETKKQEKPFVSIKEFAGNLEII